MENFFSNPSILKYLFNLSSGVNAGLAQAPNRPGAAFGVGMANAGQGMVNDLTREQNINEQLDFERKQMDQTRSQISDIISQNIALNKPVSEGIPTNTEQDAQASQMNKLINTGLALSLSGNPNLAQIGSTLMNVGSALTPKEKWTTQNLKDENGKDVMVNGSPVIIQKNSLTGEVKFPPETLLTGGRMVWDQNLHTFVPEKGIPSNQIVNGQYVPTGVSAPSTGGGTSATGRDASIMNPQAAVTPSTAPVGTGIEATPPAGMTEGERIQFQTKQAEAKAEEQRKIAAEQRSEAGKVQQLRAEDEQKRITEARTNLEPSAVKKADDSFTQSNQYINDMKTMAEAAYGDGNSLYSIPGINELRKKYLWTTGAQALRSIDNAAVKMGYSHMESMRAAGTPSDLFKTDADMRNYMKTMIITDQGKQAFDESVARVQAELNAERERALAKRQSDMETLQRNNINFKMPEGMTPSQPSNAPTEAPIETRTVKNPDGSTREVKVRKRPDGKWEEVTGG